MKGGVSPQYINLDEMHPGKSYMIKIGNGVPLKMQYVRRLYDEGLGEYDYYFKEENKNPVHVFSSPDHETGFVKISHVVNGGKRSRRHSRRRRRRLTRK